MNKYELMYIIDNSADEPARDALIAQFEKIVTDGGGKVDKIEKMGTKKFSYPINFKEDGFYVLMTYNSAPNLPKEIERKMNNNEKIVRWMTIRK